MNVDNGGVICCDGDVVLANDVVAVAVAGVPADGAVAAETAFDVAATLDEGNVINDTRTCGLF